jgi:hypothetical protein
LFAGENDDRSYNWRGSRGAEDELGGAVYLSDVIYAVGEEVREVALPLGVVIPIQYGVQISLSYPIISRDLLLEGRLPTV